MNSTDPDIVARNRWFLIMLVNMGTVAGAVFGLVLMGRSIDMGPRILGAAIVVVALYLMAVLPKMLARRWRTPPNP